MIRLKFEKEADKVINNGWKHGKYADFWSLVHINTGILVGITAVFFSLPFYYTAIFVAILLFAYEVFEMSVNEVEDFQNVITDIAIAFLGFVFSYTILQYLELSYNVLLFVFALILALSLFLDYLGWKNYISIKTEIAEYEYLELRPRIVVFFVVVAVFLFLGPILI